MAMQASSTPPEEGHGVLIEQRDQLRVVAGLSGGQPDRDQ